MFTQLRNKLNVSLNNICTRGEPDVYQYQNGKIYVLFFLMAVLVHNTEEALLMPKWQYAAKSINWDVFYIVMIVITLLLFLFSFVSIKNKYSGFWFYCLCGYAVAMVINGIIPHVLASFFYCSYCPGLLSYVVGILPSAYLLLTYAIKQRKLNQFKILITGFTFLIGFTLSLLALIQ